METLRYLDYLKADGTVIINEEEIYPPSVNLGDAAYPGNVVEITSQYFKKVKVVNALELARKAGNVRAVNTALLGVLSNDLTLTADIWDRVLKDSFPPKALKANLQAFNLGKSS